MASPPLSERHVEAPPLGLGKPMFFPLLFSIPNRPGCTQEEALLPLISFSQESTLIPQHMADEMVQARKTEQIKHQSLRDRDEELLKQEAERIAQTVQQGQSQLVPCFGTVLHPKNPYIIMGGHALGVRFSPDTNPDFIICSIFNSGFGLEGHESAPLAEGKSESERKFDHEYVIRIPKDELTPERVFLLLKYCKLSVDEVYELFDQIPKAERIQFKDKQEQLGREPIYKTSQKTDNCSVMWIINGYFPSQLSQSDFHKVKAEMFNLAFKEGLADPKTLVVIEKHSDLVQLRLERKMDKAALH